MPDIHIEMDETVVPVQQKQRQMPIHYEPRLKEHLEECIKEGVEGVDTRPMKKAIKQSHFHIPMPQELGYEFQGSD